jgi:4-amino-4-deoxy-L-arabinose transferase-like glycosyltransferase
MAAGFVMRLVNLGSGLAYDEIVTLVQYVRLPAAKLLTTCVEFNNHMFFSLLAHGSIAIFGESAWALRLPAVLLGVAAIPAIWWFASLVAGRREAIAAALLLTVSPHHIGFSQSARGYTGLVLFTILGTGLFIRGIREGRLRTWLAYAAVNAAAIFTHLTAAFTLAGQAAIWLFLYVRARTAGGGAGAPPGARNLHGLVGCVFGGVLSLLLYAPLIPQLASSFGAHIGAESEWTKVREWTNPLWTLREFVEGLGSSPIAIAAVLIGGLLTLAGMVSIARRDAVAVLAMLVFAPIALAIFWGLGFHIWPRYFFPLLGFFLVFVVRGIEVVAHLVARSRAPAVATAAVLLLALAFIAASTPLWRLPKQDYEGARDFVAATRAPGEPVITAGMAALAYGWYYAPDWTEVKDPAALDRAREAAPRSWFVYSFPTALRSSNPGVLERAEATFEVVRTFPGTIRDGAVVVLRSR